MALSDTLPNVQLWYGPMLIGVFFNMILYGVLFAQMLTYARLYKTDAMWLRLLVLFLFCVETVNTALDMVMMYQPLVLEYGQTPVLFPTGMSPGRISCRDSGIHVQTKYSWRSHYAWCVPCMAASAQNKTSTQVLVSMPIEFYLAWRIYKLTEVPVDPPRHLSLSTGGLWTSLQIYLLKDISAKIFLHNSALLWLLAACVADVVITISLVLILTGKKTGFTRMDSILDKLIRTTIQTGMITNFVWDITLSKLYVNCLLSMLNERRALSLVSHAHSGPTGWGKEVVFLTGLAFESSPAAIDGITSELPRSRASQFPRRRSNSSIV
ncbi:hypothetical protein DFH09DRAFT_1157259 [Mycena vulgaris]|nr:hypothetical protein DFH09DRAFT_1157259 [Mycena vulgaris]